MLRMLMDELREIENRKYDAVVALIKKAVLNQVHVDLMVRSPIEGISAEQYLELIGFPKGASIFTHVVLMNDDAPRPGHLPIAFDRVRV